MVPKSGNPTWKPKKFKNEVHYKELAKHTKYIVENIIPITDDNPCRCEICRIGRKKLFSLKVSHYLGGEKAKFRITSEFSSNSKSANSQQLKHKTQDQVHADLPSADDSNLNQEEEDIDLPSFEMQPQITSSILTSSCTLTSQTCSRK